VLKEKYATLFKDITQHVLMRARSNLKANIDPDQRVPEI
jgi:hypothetical protein